MMPINEKYGLTPNFYTISANAQKIAAMFMFKPDGCQGGDCRDPDKLFRYPRTVFKDNEFGF